MDNHRRSVSLAQIRQDPCLVEILDKIATMVGNGWKSSPQIAWTAVGNDKYRRSDTYRVLDAIVAEGIWEQLKARHNDQWLDIINVDVAALRELVVGGGS